jgi:hypothetical protein
MSDDAILEFSTTLEGVNGTIELSEEDEEEA